MKKLRLTAAILFLAVSCVFGQDPVKIAPEHYKVVFENDQVRVVRATRGPHEKAPMHEHPEYVSVYLTDVHQRITLPDGTVQMVNRKAGETALNKPVKHAEENVSDQPLEVIAIELKPGGRKPVSPWPLPLDPVKLDPKYHTVDSENDHVRVLRTKLAPHVPSPMHDHPNYVVVYLTDLHTKMSFPNAPTVDNRRKKGDVAFREAYTHQTENVEDTLAEEIQVELK